MSMRFPHRMRAVAHGTVVALVLVLSLILSSTRLLSQQPTLIAPPARDVTARRPGTGTAVIRGRVRNAADGRPLRDVRVRLNNASLADQLSDDNGQFAFTSLTAGAYALSATKGGYITLARGTVPGRPTQTGPSILLAEGQVEEIEFALEKGGVVSGHVVDQQGHDVAGAYVSLYRFVWTQGYRSLASVTFRDQTDDRGQFRLFGIPPGTYLVGAVMRRPSGEGGLAAYSPAAFSPADAASLIIRAGQEISATISLPAVQTASIRGSVRRSDGQSALHANTVSLERADAPRSGVVISSTALVQPDGTFRFNALAPGEYIVRSVTNTTGSEQDRLFAVARVVLNGSDLTVPLVLSRGSTMRGRYRFDTGEPPSDLKLSTAASTAVTPVTLPMEGQPRLTVAPDWTFVLNGLMGDYRLKVPTPSGWFVKRITLRGTDVTYAPLKFAGEDVEGLEVLLTRRTTHLNVSLSGTAGQLRSAQIVIVPEDDAKRWPQTPFLKLIDFDRLPAVGTLVQGSGPQSITASGLPPAKYLIAAVTNLPDDWEAPEFLNRLRDVAVTVDLVEEEPRSVDLQVGVAP